MPIDLNDHLAKRGGNNEKGTYQPPFEPPEFMKNFGKKAGVIYVLVAIIAIIFLLKPFVIINSGEVGIQSTAGKYDPIPLEPGIHFFIPIIQKVIVVDTKIRIINYRGAEAVETRSKDGILTADAITVLDSRGLPVSIDLTVQYRLKPMSAPQTIATWGLSWEEKIVNPVVRDVVRSVIGRFLAEELPTRRNEIASLIDSEIRSRMDKLENDPVEFSSVQLREIVLPPKIKEQIERVQIARQEAERAKEEVEKARQEAEKKAALAKGEADARRITAQGIADAIAIEAEAQAKANEIISRSLTENILKLKQIEVQAKFNEALKENIDAKIFLTPGGAVPNIWMDAKSDPIATQAIREKRQKAATIDQQNQLQQNQQ